VWLGMGFYSPGAEVLSTQPPRGRVQRGGAGSRGLRFGRLALLARPGGDVGGEGGAEGDVVVRVGVQLGEGRVDGQADVAGGVRGEVREGAEDDDGRVRRVVAQAVLQRGVCV